MLSFRVLETTDRERFDITQQLQKTQDIQEDLDPVPELFEGKNNDSLSIKNYLIYNQQ